MKAIVWTKYGSSDGLHLKEVDKPIPKSNELLIKIHATTVSMGDCELRSLKLPILFRIPMRLFFGLRKPRDIILGQELAGEVDLVGEHVKNFKRGDQIFAVLGFGFGSYAEYKCLSDEAVISTKPTSMSFEEAAPVANWGIIALHFIRKAAIQKDEKILIIGAAGSIGTYAIQLAKYYSAEVTAVDSTEKLNILLSIGADEVIDYTKEDFLRSNKKYDIIFDVTGKASYGKCLTKLNPKGRLLLANPKMLQILRSKWTIITGNKKVISNQPTHTKDDLLFLKGLIDDNKLTTVIDKSFSLEEIPQAHEYVESGKKIGHVVISILHEQ